MAPSPHLCPRTTTETTATLDPLSSIAIHVVMRRTMRTCHSPFPTCPSMTLRNALPLTCLRPPEPTCPLPAQMCAAMLYHCATARLHTSTSCIDTRTAAVHALIPTPRSHFRLCTTTGQTPALHPLSNLAIHIFIHRSMHTCHSPFPICLSTACSNALAPAYHRLPAPTSPLSV